MWQLSIAASYWLVNKSGLPLIFKQDGSQTPAAGQFEEHELARCVAPLLFCFADNEKYELYVYVDSMHVSLCLWFHMSLWVIHFQVIVSFMFSA